MKSSLQSPVLWVLKANFKVEGVFLERRTAYQRALDNFMNGICSELVPVPLFEGSTVPDSSEMIGWEMQ
jgi:hypothetical protein